MKTKAILAALMSSALIFSACSGSAATNSSSTTGSTPAPSSSQEAASESTPAGEGGTIKVAGSTSVAPLMREIKEVYESANSGIVIEIQESGSSAGITATIEGAAEIGMSSRELKDAEKEQGVIDTVIAMDGIAVVVHPENPITALSKEQISGIFKGEISNWNEVGGEDAGIIVVSREEGSGTRGAFEELLDLEGEDESLLSGDALFENSTGGVKANIASSKNAIGYISLGSLDETVVALDVDGVACTVESVKDGSYSIARPFLVCTMGEIEGIAKDFIDYILSEEGQEIVEDNNYINVL